MKLIGKTVRITSDNDNYLDWLNRDLIITDTSIGGHFYDDSLYPQRLCELKCVKTGEECPFALYEFEFTA